QLADEHATSRQSVSARRHSARAASPSAQAALEAQRAKLETLDRQLLEQALAEVARGQAQQQVAGLDVGVVGHQHL
ncbi:hypothetical protein ACV33Q_31470, partial [Pseudomonas aeruginosa]